MPRLILLLSLLLGSSPLYAAQCFYYWSADCFDIRDALERDITHHVFLSQEVREITLNGSCDAATLAAEHPALVKQATDRLNRALDRVKSCRTLEQATPRVFQSRVDASRQWQQLSSEQQFKRLRWVKNLP